MARCKQTRSSTRYSTTSLRRWTHAARRRRRIRAPLDDRSPISLVWLPCAHDGCHRKRELHRSARGRSLESSFARERVLIGESGEPKGARHFYSYTLIESKRGSQSRVEASEGARPVLLARAGRAPRHTSQKLPTFPNAYRPLRCHARMQARGWAALADAQLAAAWRGIAADGGR